MIGAENRYNVQLPVFTGPLDLLLHLIEREELDVSRVSLAKVTGQFLEHLRRIEEQQIQEIADFLVIAARLILIKSQSLLPRPPEEEAADDAVDSGAELAVLLQEYKRYKEVAALLLERHRAGLRTFVRVMPPPQIEPRLDMSGVTIEALAAAYVQALAAPSATRARVDSVVRRPKVTIVQKIQAVAQALRRRGRTSFFGLLRSARSRTEIIVTFLAVLELVKQRLVTVKQEHNFGDIEISTDGDWALGDDFKIVPELEGVPGPTER